MIHAFGWSPTRVSVCRRAGAEEPSLFFVTLAQVTPAAKQRVTEILGAHGELPVLPPPRTCTQVV
jgi:hypothetical protein